MRLKRFNELTPLDALQVGLALMLVYWSYRYAGGSDPAAVASASLLGPAFVVLALVAVTRNPLHQDIANLALGLVALSAPLLLGFTDVGGATGMHVKIGLVVLLLTGVRMAVNDPYLSGKATGSGEGRDPLDPVGPGKAA